MSSLSPLSTGTRAAHPSHPLLRPLDGLGRLAWIAGGIGGVYVTMLVSAGRQGAWLIAADGRPRPMDFAIFWLAARMSSMGQALAVYDVTTFATALVRLSGDDTARLPFVYPPLFLLMLSPLGALPYVWAAVVWSAAGLTAYLAAARAILSRWCALPLALAAPGVLWCLVVAQNGLFTAALLGFGLVLAPRRPVVAGLVLGALAFKPQLALALPVAFLAVGAWRTIAAAALSAASLTALPVVRFGPAIVPAFWHAGAQANARLGGAHMPWPKVQSLYGALRGAGAPLGWAAGVQVVVAVATASALAWLWRTRAPDALKAAAAATATLVLTPYSFVYDLPILGVAALFLLRDAARVRFDAAECALMAVAVLSPLTFAVTPAAVTPLACGTTAVLILKRLRPREPLQLRRFNSYQSRAQHIDDREAQDCLRPHIEETVSRV